MKLSQWLAPYLSESSALNLAKLLKNLEKTTLTISGVVTDNRDVQQGDCFIALAGINHHGKTFIDDAVARGAVAVVLEGPTEVDEYLGLPVVSLANVKTLLNHLLIDFYKDTFETRNGYPFGMRLLAVTGTNGKSSITRFVAQMSHALQQPAGLMGTLGFGTWPDITDSKNTTPELAVLLRQFNLMRKQGAEVVAMEVSSHGIEQQRIESLVFDAAVFSNLTQDHLDYHGDMESYYSIKRSLFLAPSLKYAIINGDDEYGQRLLADGEITAQKISYGFSELADVRIVDWHTTTTSMTANIESPWGCAQFSIDMVGDFNLANVLAAIALLAVEEKFIWEDIVTAIGSISSAPGRMQGYRKKHGAAAVIDFAHTPDALSNVLSTLKKQTQGKLAVVFGCGGDRDTEKRPLMAAIAQQHADLICLSSDNPRTENLDGIIADVMAGFQAEHIDAVMIETDRATAIEHSLLQLNENDVLLIAGKGHERYQDIKGEKQPYSDEAVLLSLGYQSINAVDSHERNLS